MIKKIIAALAAAGTLVMVAQADSRSNATPAAVPALERSGFEHLRGLDLKADLYTGGDRQGLVESFDGAGRQQRDFPR